ncbi:hypothetical protein AAFF_G00325970 [Aldrovandia affinis]|uniref:Uncharacterized protein n=1 Tax=Aldrovandia affinis TaxID=143900 RepID=A0AAD7T968_9TELE|nr:hypothetical protein AAFF_G00325970 [Aldrovandia affinis]
MYSSVAVGLKFSQAEDPGHVKRRGTDLGPRALLSEAWAQSRSPSERDDGPCYSITKHLPDSTWSNRLHCGAIDNIPR